jgi:hypothetical protein
VKPCRPTASEANARERGVYAALSFGSRHVNSFARVRPTLKRPESRAPRAAYACPNGASSLSPGFRGTSYPGSRTTDVHNPNGVASRVGHDHGATPLGLNHGLCIPPRVVAPLQPWALGRSPVGAAGSTDSATSPAVVNLTRL